jgi:hypothetical protein
MHWMFDLVGLLGSAMIHGSYALSQAHRLDVRRPLYPALNGLGAAFVLVSLAVDFNLAATVIESAWLLISAYGLVRAIKSRRTD